MSNLPEDLLIECCNAIEQRRRNGGDWEGGKGPPKCILEVCSIMRWDNNLQKILLAESYISIEAIRLVAERFGEMKSEKPLTINFTCCRCGCSSDPVPFKINKDLLPEDWCETGSDLNDYGKILYTCPVCLKKLNDGV